MDLFQNKCYFIIKIRKNRAFFALKRVFMYLSGVKMPANEMPPLSLVGESHQGRVRSHNEDNFVCISLFPGYYFAAVADGVGGHSGGEVASYLCCHRLLLDWKKRFRSNPEPTEAMLARFMIDSVLSANSDIFSANTEHKRGMPMCTTLAAAIFTPQMVIVAHAGDSRVYCRSKNKCMQLTVDHTVENELTEQGITDPRYLPGSHVISRAVGPFGKLRPEIHTYFRHPEDRYLLCTDGLTNYWSTEEIGENLTGCQTAREANNRFVRETLRRGAIDNVTVISVFPVSEQ